MIVQTDISVAEPNAFSELKVSVSFNSLNVFFDNMTILRKEIFPSLDTFINCQSKLCKKHCNQIRDRRKRPMKLKCVVF